MSAIDELRSLANSGQVFTPDPGLLVGCILELADRVMPVAPPATDAAVIAAQPITVTKPELSGGVDVQAGVV